MSYKEAAQSAGITPETLCRWIARGKVESGLFHEFYESVQEALAHFEWVHLKNIERSALEESKIIRQTVKYKGGEILNGQLKNGKVKYATIGSKFRPPKAEASMWLLARRFPERWGPQAKGAAHEGKAPDRQATVIFFTKSGFTYNRSFTRYASLMWRVDTSTQIQMDEGGWTTTFQQKGLAAVVNYTYKGSRSLWRVLMGQWKSLTPRAVCISHVEEVLE